MQVIVATKNKGKLREFERILAPHGMTVIGMQDMGMDVEIEETGTTFAENARIKAMTLHKLTGKAVVADDSGLCVEALGGRPGVYSARYGGEDTDYPTKIAMLLEELRDVPEEQRTASYECAIHLILPDSSEYQFYGRCVGHIGYECRGENGFGYDPIFYIGQRSIAQFDDGEKDAVSHRGKALEAFAKAVEQLPR